MIVHRFMSRKEYEALMAGEILHNDTDHGAGGGKSTSVGFCFFHEAPEKAIHRLVGLVDCDYCVTMDIPSHLLDMTEGCYRDVEKDDGKMQPCDVPTMWYKEFCLTRYSIRDVRIINVTEEYRWYGRIPEDASFWERIERLRRIGELETKRLEEKGKRT